MEEFKLRNRIKLYKKKDKVNREFSTKDIKIFFLLLIPTFSFDI